MFKTTVLTDELIIKTKIMTTIIAVKKQSNVSHIFVNLWVVTVVVMLATGSYSNCYSEEWKHLQMVWFFLI